MKEDLASS